MNLKQLKEILLKNQKKNLSFHLQNEIIPLHFHITEIGRESRVFIDCGGVKRKTEKCVLQIWVANDFDHRVDSDKMLKIIDLGESLFEHDIPNVFIEYEKDSVSQYPIDKYEITEGIIKFYAGENHTACLAPEKCGVSCCSSPQQIIKLV